MNIEIVLNWKYGHPKLTGMYFAAVKYGEGAGSFEFVNFKDGSWEIDSNSTVIAFMELHELKNQLSIRWPYTRSENPKNANTSESWEEV